MACLYAVLLVADRILPVFPGEAFHDHGAQPEVDRQPERGRRPRGARLPYRRYTTYTLQLHADGSGSLHFRPDTLAPDSPFRFGCGARAVARAFGLG